MAMAAKRRSICPECNQPIEVAEMITRKDQRWIHATHQPTVEPPKRQRYDDAASLDQKLDRLVGELAALYGRPVQIDAAMRFTFYSSWISEITLYLGEHQDDAVDNDEFAARSPFLYRVARMLMLELSTRSDSDIAGVFWGP